MKPVLARVAAGRALSCEEAHAAFGMILDGAASEAQIASLLTALHVRGETRDEFRGALLAMRARMVRVEAPPNTVDVCGTGGDGLATLNISTATAFVVAGCGVNVAKHGNRAVSSRSGGADVLRALGVEIDVQVERQAGILAECGLAFLFAPAHHPGLRHAAGVRRALGFRTLFNLLGPAANPAGVRRQLTGVFDPAWAGPMAEILGELGGQKVWLVHGMGLDELTLAGETNVAEWSDGRLRRFTVTPEMAGLGRAPLDAVGGGDAAANAAALGALLMGEPGAYRDTVLFNAAAALVVAGMAADLREGVAFARESLDRGRALSVLKKLRLATRLAEAPLPMIRETSGAVTVE